jgi:hypothetical protein
MEKQKNKKEESKRQPNNHREVNQVQENRARARETKK